MEISLSNKKINEINMDKVCECMKWNQPYIKYMNEPSGKEHYKLLAYLSLELSKLKEKPQISDIGTLYGSSALSFALNPDAEITTYDILNFVPQLPENMFSINSIPNITRKFMSGQLDIKNIAKSDVVLLDVDPHDGIQEKKFIELLDKANFKGILIIDDIKLNEDMKSMWDYIVKTYSSKYIFHDISNYGHWSGTGLIIFNHKYLNIKINE